MRVILSSHLLRDVEECCDEVIILKDGQGRRVATWRRSAGPTATSWSWSCAPRAAPRPTPAGRALGLRSGDRSGARQRLKIVLPEGVEVRDLYRLAAEREIQIRRLDYKRDSLEDIFLKAMED